MWIHDLQGAFTCTGFLRKLGRRPTIEDASFIAGPLHIEIDVARGLIHEITKGEGQSVLRREGDVDGRGMVAMPGFVDCHTHSLFAGTRSREHFRRWRGESYAAITASGGGIHSTVRATEAASDEELQALLVSRLRHMHRHGTAAVEVKSGYASSAEGELRLLRITRAASQYDGLPHVTPTFMALHALPVGRCEEDYAREMIAALDVVVRNGLARFVDAFPERGYFSLATVCAFVDAAYGCGLPSRVHSDELSNLGSSIAMVRRGSASIDHLQCIAPDAIEALSRSETVAVLMPATSFFAGLPYADARRLIDAGCRVALASDFNPGTAPHGSMRFPQLLAASQLRMTAAEILCSSSVNAAASLGLQGRFGCLAPGYAGPILLFRSGAASLNEDPEALLEEIFLSTSAPEAVVP